MAVKQRKINVARPSKKSKQELHHLREIKIGEMRQAGANRGSRLEIIAYEGSEFKFKIDEAILSEGANMNSSAGELCFIGYAVFDRHYLSLYQGWDTREDEPKGKQMYVPYETIHSYFVY